MTTRLRNPRGIQIMKSTAAFLLGTVFIFIATSMPLVGQFMTHHGGDYLRAADIPNYDKMMTGQITDDGKQVHKHVEVGTYNLIVIFTCIMWGIGFAVLGGILIDKSSKEGS